MMWVHRLGLEHAKQFLLTGRAIDSETALRIGLVSEVHSADELSAAAEAEARRLATIPGNQMALNKMIINQAYENMGLRTTQMLGTFFDGMARHTEEALRWAKMSPNVALKMSSPTGTVLGRTTDNARSDTRPQHSSSAGTRSSAKAPRKESTLPPPSALFRRRRIRT